MNLFASIYEQEIYGLSVHILIKHLTHNSQEAGMHTNVNDWMGLLYKGEAMLFCVVPVLCI